MVLINVLKCRYRSGGKAMVVLDELQGRCTSREEARQSWKEKCHCGSE